MDDLSAERLQLARRQVPGAVVIEVAGELDATTTPLLDDMVRQAQERPADHLVFDLGGVPFMDSSGLRVLLSAYHEAKRHGARVFLASLRAGPARVIELSRIADHLPVHATADEALQALAAGGENGPAPE